MDAAQYSEAGLLIRRALDLRAALNLGVRIGFEDIRADEFAAMIVLDEERNRWEMEQASRDRP